MGSGQFSGKCRLKRRQARQEEEIRRQRLTRWERASCVSGCTREATIGSRPVHASTGGRGIRRGKRGDRRKAEPVERTTEASEAGAIGAIYEAGTVSDQPIVLVVVSYLAMKRKCESATSGQISGHGKQT